MNIQQGSLFRVHAPFDGQNKRKQFQWFLFNISPSHYRCLRIHWRESTSSYAQESSTDTPTDILLGREVQDAFKVLMTRWLCNSHDVSHFAAFFIVIGAKTSVAESVWLLSFCASVHNCLLAEVLISLIWFIFVCLVQFNLELTKDKRHNGSSFFSGSQPKLSAKKKKSLVSTERVFF
jgi:hypothetical protein